MAGQGRQRRDFQFLGWGQEEEGERDPPCWEENQNATPERLRTENIAAMLEEGDPSPRELMVWV